MTAYPAKIECRLCSTTIVLDVESQEYVAPDGTACPRGERHLPPWCYCGGPESAVYGHLEGTGHYCRRRTP